MNDEVRNLRDFLTLYNSLTETCFNHCVIDLNHRDLVNTEESCLYRCIDKHINSNRRAMTVFTDIGPDFLARKQQQQAAEAAKQ